MGQLNDPVTVESVSAGVIRPLRREVLRVGLPEDSVRFRGDDHPLALHVAARFVTNDRKGEVIAVGTIFPDAPPWEPTRVDAWRIRGMATRERYRGHGLGRLALDALVAHATDHDGTFLWCHARVGALDFYRHAGFVTIGERFDDGVAIHQSMWRTLEPHDEGRSPA
jgi:GNAT superfamily N-acetyltransferase